MLDYKGYHAKVEYRPGDGLPFGRVLGVRDTVVFEAEAAAEVWAAFEGAVDDYLAFCADTGKDPTARSAAGSTSAFRPTSTGPPRSRPRPGTRA